MKDYNLLLTIIFGVISVLGTIFGIYSYRDSKKSKEQLKQYTYLFDLAKLNIDTQTTKEDLDNLLNQYSQLQNEIKTKIPLEARRTVLTDKLQTIKSTIAENYQQYSMIQKELNNLIDNDISLSKDIRDEIELYIMPEHTIEKKKEKMKDYCL